MGPAFTLEDIGQEQDFFNGSRKLDERDTKPTGNT
jgi:hypothetical protein